MGGCDGDRRTGRGVGGGWSQHRQPGGHVSAPRRLRW